MTTPQLVKPEGTYLVWLDFKELGLDAKALAKFLAQEARLALNAGYWFGREGAGYARMNIAAPRSVLESPMLSIGSRTEVEMMLTMRPVPAASIPGTRACVMV